MAIQLTNKERMLLQDQKSHEELCISKYQSYANQAKDPALSQLFDSLAKKEQEHLNSVNQILNGQIPAVQQGQQAGQGQMQQAGSGGTRQPGQGAMGSPASGIMQQAGQSAMMKASAGMKMEAGSQSQMQAGDQSGGQSQMQSGRQGRTQSGNQTGAQHDSMLCKDMLSTEKFVSGAYNTAIFECANTQIRQVLNHIQKEEQEHGDQIFKYMQSNGMYSVQ